MNAAQEGWYQDPEEWENERFWDGVQWTDQIRAKAIAKPARPGAESSVPSSDNATTQQVHPAEMVSAAEPGSSLFGRKSPEQRAEKEAAKQRAANQKAAARNQAEAQRAAKEFAASPVGRARIAFERGDQVF